MALVTCRTPGCINVDRPIELAVTFVDEESGETRDVDAVICGACGQPITDISEGAA